MTLSQEKMVAAQEHASRALAEIPIQRAPSPDNSVRATPSRRPKATTIAKAVELAAKAHGIGDVREVAPVGSSGPEGRKVQDAGAAARGFALAQSVFGIVKSVARDLRRCVETAFDYDPDSRGAAAKELARMAKQAKADTEANGNLSSWDKKERNRMVSSALVQSSKFTTVLKAMNAGMTRDTIARELGQDVDQVVHVSFDIIVRIARKVLASDVSGRGRKPDLWETKLRKWLDANHPAKEDKQRFDFYAHLREEMSKEFPQVNTEGVPTEGRKPPRRASAPTVATA